jgi:hypothetical protein
LDLADWIFDIGNHRRAVSCLGCTPKATQLKLPFDAAGVKGY